jgi:hypothetical protein
VDPLQEKFEEAKKHIWDLPERLEELDPFQRALLKNDNEALKLDPLVPTYEPNTSAASRLQRTVESSHRNGNFLDAMIPPRYTPDYVEASLTRRNAGKITNSLFRVAAYC